MIVGDSFDLDLSGFDGVITDPSVTLLLLGGSVMTCRHCDGGELVHKHGRCLGCHRALNARRMREWRSDNREKNRKADRERKRAERAAGTDYAERQRTGKRTPGARRKTNAARRTPVQRKKNRDYQRSHRLRPDAQQKNKARSALNCALVCGKLVRPSTCELCGRDPGRGSDGRSLIRADHYKGYDRVNHLNVQWVCTTCDGVLESERRR